MTPRDRRLEPQLAPRVSARVNSSAPWLGEQLLVGGDHRAPGAGPRARSRGRLEAADQLDDHVASSARISSKSPSTRVSTPASSGRRPVSRLDRIGALGEQLHEGAADRAAAEQADLDSRRRHRARADPRRSRGGRRPAPRRPGRRSPAAAARRCNCSPSRSRRRRSPARPACRRPRVRRASRRAGSRRRTRSACRRRGQGVGPPARSAITRLVARAVEHRPHVVGHAAVDRDVGAHAGDLLDGPDRVGGDAGVADQRAAGLDEDLAPGRRPLTTPRTLTST